MKLLSNHETGLTLQTYQVDSIVFLFISFFIHI